MEDFKYNTKILEDYEFDFDPNYCELSLFYPSGVHIDTIFFLMSSLN